MNAEKIETRYAVKSLKTGRFLLRVENHKLKFCDTPIPLSRSYAAGIVKRTNEHAGRSVLELHPVEAYLHPEFGWKLVK